MPHPPLDLVGNTFGRWAVLARDGKIGTSSAFLCRCKCGNERRVSGPSLNSGGSTSCGCAGREKLGDQNRTHGMGGKHHLYGTWVAMRDRCRRPGHHAYHRYGGRGIAVCPEWSDFPVFLEDMLPTWEIGKTLDRIDNDGPYSPKNCRWATQKQQCQNKAITGRAITHDGVTITITQWGKRLGIKPPLISQRLFRGLTVERALRPTKGR